MAPAAGIVMRRRMSRIVTSFMVASLKSTNPQCGHAGSAAGTPRRQVGQLDIAVTVPYEKAASRLGHLPGPVKRGETV